MDDKGISAGSALQLNVSVTTARGEARGLDSVMEMKQNCFLPESLQKSLL